jgi:hypothetical protein
MSKKSTTPPSFDTKTRNILVAVGFILFILNALGLFLSLVGVKLMPLAWMDSLGQGFSLFGKMFMMILGIVIVVIARTKDDDYDEFLDGN